jgi:hypothetical protein
MADYGPILYVFLYEFILSKDIDLLKFLTKNLMKVLRNVGVAK